MHLWCAFLALVALSVLPVNQTCLAFNVSRIQSGHLGAAEQIHSQPLVRNERAREGVRLGERLTAHRYTCALTGLGCHLLPAAA